jgi:glycosyltransferase involved in cell wall biosynthesis
MVTANRPQLMKRALYSYLKQTYPNTEMVVIDDGETDLSDPLSMVPSDELKYEKLDSNQGYVLGALRNRSLQVASGEYLVQWDDDDWYHPERIERQINVLVEGDYDACCLPSSLMHLDSLEFLHHPYIGELPEGIPGSIMHRRSDIIRYPETRRSEDTAYLKDWMKKRYTKLPDDQYHLFIRCYHGRNTWEQQHFLRRMRNSPANLISFLWYKYIKQDLFQHPKFQLHPQAQEAFDEYLADSQKFGLLDN